MKPLEVGDTFSYFGAEIGPVLENRGHGVVLVDCLMGGYKMTFLTCMHCGKDKREHVELKCLFGETEYMGVH